MHDSIGRRQGLHDHGLRAWAVLTWLLLAAHLVVAAGCTPAASGENTRRLSTPDPSRDKGTIGLSVLTLTNPFFKEIADTFTAEANRRGYRVVAVSGDFDVARQQNQVKDFIVQQAAAIVLCPCDSRAIGPAIQEADAAGIPVFTADIACLAPGAKVVSHIATDNYGGGKQAAEAMIEALGPGGGKVLILDYKQAESCLLRVKGFKEVIERHNAAHPHARVQIVSELPGDGQKDKGYKAAEDALQAHPDLAGVFAINDPSALGARAAIEKAQKTSQVKIIGFDGQADGKQAIREGKIYADPIQFPDRIAKLAVESIVRYFDGERVASEQLIPTALYRRGEAEKEMRNAE